MLSSAPFIAELPQDLAGKTASLVTVHGRYGNNALNGDWELGLTSNTSAPPQNQVDRTWNTGTREPFTFSFTNTRSDTFTNSLNATFSIGGSGVQFDYGSQFASYEPNAIKIWASTATATSSLTINDLRITTPGVTGQTVFPGASIAVSQASGTVFQEIIIAGIDFQSVSGGTVTLEGNVTMQFAADPALRGSAIQFHVIATHIPWVDLDVDSNNNGTIDPVNGRRGTDDRIEQSAPGKIIPVGGARAEMLITLPAGRSATLEIDPAVADKVRVFDPTGKEVLNAQTHSTTVNGNSPQMFTIEAVELSEREGDIVFTLTADDNGPPARDIVRATAMALTVQSNGIVSGDDGRLWVYACVSDATRPTGSPGTVTFELLRADGSTTGVTGSATVVDGFAYTVLNLPDRLLHIDPANPAASTYRVRARYGSLTTESDETAVVPGLAKNIQAVANVAFTAKPGLSFNITDAIVPFLRDFAGVGRVEVTATVRDRLGNLVADGTPVIWGTVDDGFNPDDVLNSGTETVNGVASFAIAANRIRPVARLSVTADLTTITGFLSGGELRVTLELLDTNNQPAGDRIIDLDDRWWFAIRSETIRVRATVRRQDGSPVGPGVPVKFHDTKRLLGDAPVLTDSNGQAVADLFVPNDRASWSILGRNVVTASAAGYSAQAETRIVGKSILPPVDRAAVHQGAYEPLRLQACGRIGLADCGR